MKRTKKIALIMLAVMLMAVCFVFGASALNATGQCGDNVYWDFDSATGELVISGMGPMYDYGYSSSPFYNSNIKSVVVEDGTTTISNYAFQSCDGITSVTLGDSVTSIGNYAFCDTGYYNNSSNWENNVLYIGEYLIKANISLSGFCIIKEGTKLIADSAFQSCNSLTSVTIPNSVTIIGENAFESCNNLTNIIIPDSVTIIGDRAFNNTGYYNNSANWEDDILYIGKHLVDTKEAISGEVVIREGTLTIAEDAFFGKIYATKIIIPKDVKNIADGAFTYCYGLEGFVVSENNVNFFSDEYGVLYNKEKTELIKCPSMCSVKKYDIPNTVKKINDGSFEFVYNIVDINIPEGVTSIGDSAFSGCMKLENVILPSTLKTIENRAFEACISLKNITIPENVSYISGKAFMDTANENVYIKSMDTKYGEYPVFESSFIINGSRIEVAELYQKMQVVDNMEEAYKLQEEVMKRLSYFDNEEPKATGTIYCHSGSTAETYAIENGVKYELTHFFEGEWTYDYDNMIRTRKCIHCDELETEKLESTENGDIEIIEPVDPDTDFEVDEIKGDNFIVVEETVVNGIEGNAEVLRAFDITLKNKDGVHVQPDGTVKVKLPLNWTKDGIYKVYRVNDDGTLTDMNAYRQGSHMVFETDHFSIYVIVDVSEKSEADEPEIPDVPTEPDTSDCNCICHAKDIIKRFIAIIYKFVIELLGIEHICDCGVAHY